MAIRGIKSAPAITVRVANRFPELTLLSFSFFEKLDMTQGVHGNDAANRADAVRRVANSLIQVQDEVRRVNYFSSLFPKRPHFVGVSRHFEAVSHGVGQLQSGDGFSGFVERIDGQGNNADIFFVELFNVRLEVG